MHFLSYHKYYISNQFRHEIQYIFNKLLYVSNCVWRRNRSERSCGPESCRLLCANPAPKVSNYKVVYYTFRRSAHCLHLITFFFMYCNLLKVYLLQYQLLSNSSSNYHNIDYSTLSRWMKLKLKEKQWIQMGRKKQSSFVKKVHCLAHWPNVIKPSSIHNSLLIGCANIYCRVYVYMIHTNKNGFEFTRIDL